MEEFSKELITFTDEGLELAVTVTPENETVWLTQAQLVVLYNSSKANVSEHIKNIFQDQELDEQQVVRKFRTTAKDGKNYNVTYYNLDLIISLGYRIKSVTATKFRIWATSVLRNYLQQGYVVNEKRLLAQQIIKTSQFSVRFFDVKITTNVTFVNSYI